MNNRFRFCLVQKEFKIVLNGVVVLSTDVNVERSLDKKLDIHGLTFMGTVRGFTRNFDLSLPGKIADINIWSRVLPNTEITQWAGPWLRESCLGCGTGESNFRVFWTGNPV